MKRFIDIAAFIFAAVFLSNANAQHYPNKPIKVLVGYAPGGGRFGC
jgi:tripartite-type tricarboxylate transporter receptor subunit TctC